MAVDMGAQFSIHEFRGDSSAWAQVLYDVYKPQTSIALAPNHRGGRIRQWQFGAVEVSDYECGAMRFVREARHVGPGCEDHYFISMPYLPGCEMTLSQERRTAHCPPGGMIVQHTARPSELSHPEVGAVIVRVLGTALRGRYRNTLSCLGVALPCARSAGSLFSSLARSLIENAAFIADDVKASSGETLLDLLAIALEAQAGDLPRNGHAVRSGHRAKALACIKSQFRNPELSPASVARACSISVGYLHEVFRQFDESVQEVIMETRLQAARRMLINSVGAPKSVSGVAFLCGFSDAAHFSRRFSRRFGAPPREFVARRESRDPDRESRSDEL